MKSTGVCCGGRCGDEDFYIVATDPEDGEILQVEGPYEGNGSDTHSRMDAVADGASVGAKDVKMVRLSDIPVKTGTDFRTSVVAEGEPEFESLEFLIFSEGGVQHLGLSCGLMEFGMSLPRFHTWLGRVMLAMFAAEAILQPFEIKRIEGPDALVSDGAEYPFTAWGTWTFVGDMEVVASTLINKGLKPA